MGWSDLEIEVFEANLRGEYAVFPENEPAELNADFLRALLLGLDYDGFEDGDDSGQRWVRAEVRPPLPVTGLRIRNAHIMGELILDGSRARQLPLPHMAFSQCEFRGDGRAYADTDRYEYWHSLRCFNTVLSGIALYKTKISTLTIADSVVQGNVSLIEVEPLERYKPTGGTGDKPVLSVVGDVPPEDSAWPRTTFLDETVYWPTRPQGLCFVDLSGSSIEGHLDIKHCVLHGYEDTMSLYANALRVEGFVTIKDCKIYGLARLDRSDIGHNCTIVDTQIHDPYGWALNFEGASIEGRLGLFRSAFTGTVDLTDIQSADLDFNDVTARAEAFSKSVMLGGACIGGSAHIVDLKIDDGALDFEDARVAVNVHIVKCGFGMGRLIAPGLRVGQTLILRNNEISGEVDLRAAACEVFNFRDGGLGTSKEVNLEAFSYRYIIDMEDSEAQRQADEALISEAETGSDKDRTAMLDDRRIERNKGQKKYDILNDDPNYVALGKIIKESRSRHFNKSQAYNQLLSVAAANGQFLKALDIREQKIEHDFRNERGTALPPIRFCQWMFHCLYRWWFGFGLRMDRAVLTLLVAFGIGTGLIVWMEHRNALIVDQQAVASAYGSNGLGAMSGDTESGIACQDEISAPLYALDVFIPLVDLRQETECEVGRVNGLSADYFAGIDWLGFRWGEELTVYRWLKVIYAIAGWFIVSGAIFTLQNTQRLRDGG